MYSNYISRMEYIKSGKPLQLLTLLTDYCYITYNIKSIYCEKAKQVLLGKMEKNINCFVKEHKLNHCGVNNFMCLCKESNLETATNDMRKFYIRKATNWHNNPFDVVIIKEIVRMFEYSLILIERSPERNYIRRKELLYLKHSFKRTRNAKSAHTKSK